MTTALPPNLIFNHDAASGFQFNGATPTLTDRKPGPLRDLEQSLQRKAPQQQASLPAGLQFNTDGPQTEEQDYSAMLDKIVNTPIDKKTASDAWAEYNGWVSLPFIGGVENIADLSRVYFAAERVDKGMADDRDLYLVSKYLREETGEGNIWYTVNKILQELPAFAGEIALTGGLATAGRKGASKGLKALVGRGLKAKLARAIGRRGRFAAGVPAAELARLPAFSHRAVAEAIRRSMPNVSKDEAGNLAVEFENDNGFTDAVMSNLPAGFMDTYIEIFSEQTGGIMNVAANKLGMAKLKGAIAKNWLRINPGSTADDLLKTIRSRTAWHGMIGEMFEERVGEGLRAVAPLLDEEYQPPTMDQLIAEAIAFSVPGAGAAAIKRATQEPKRAEGQVPPLRQVDEGRAGQEARGAGARQRIQAAREEAGREEGAVEAPKTSKVKKGEGKQPWEMTLKEYEERGPSAIPLEGRTEQELTLLEDTKAHPEKYLFHATPGFIKGIQREGLTRGGLSAAPESEYAASSEGWIYVFSRGDFPTDADLNDVALTPGLGGRKPIGVFKQSEYGGHIAYGARSQEEGVEQEPPGALHYEHVKEAVAAGKPVPAEVLADYPDLAPPPKGAKQTEPPTLDFGEALADALTQGLPSPPVRDYTDIESEVIEAASDFTAHHADEAAELTQEVIRQYVRSPSAGFAFMKAHVSEMAQALAGDRGVYPVTMSVDEIARNLLSDAPMFERIGTNIRRRAELTTMRMPAIAALAVKLGITEHGTKAEQIDRILAHEAPPPSTAKQTEAPKLDFGEEQGGSFEDLNTQDVDVKDLTNRWSDELTVAETAAMVHAREHEETIRRGVGKRTAGETLREATLEPGQQKARARESAAAIHLWLDFRQAQEEGKGTPQQQWDNWVDARASWRPTEEEPTNPFTELTDEQERLFERSQNLKDWELDLAKTIAAENKRYGVEAVKAGVIGKGIKDKESLIRNLREFYSARLWRPRPPSEETGRGVGKFATGTGRAKARVYDSILEGWARGRELAITSAVNAQLVARQQIALVVHSRNLIDVGLSLGIISTDRKAEGRANFILINPPAFTKYVYAGTEEGKEKDTTFLVQKQLYATPKLATHLNNVLGESALTGPVITKITKYNAILKAQMLFTSLFHHQAFLRSFLLASPGKRAGLRRAIVDLVAEAVTKKGWAIPKWLDTLAPKGAWQHGMEAIRQMSPELQELIRAGMTLGLQQEFRDDLIKQKTLLGKMLDKAGATRVLKNMFLNVRDQQIHFLFNTMGPALKAQAALLELHHRTTKVRAKALAAGTVTRQEIAEAVAEAVNNDFGGLNLRRKGRNPTTQHLLRLFLLAPDWTESNVTSMVRVFDGIPEGKWGTEMARVHRRMWGRVLIRGMGITVVWNILMAALDDDEEFLGIYKRMWDQGHLRWLAMDITPIYKAMGGQSPTRKYFTFIGHFRDPFKFTVQARPGEQWYKGPDPLYSVLKSARNKGSIVFNTGWEMMTGLDWTGARRFTTAGELLGKDDKGVYLRSGKRKDGTRYYKGQPKGGQMQWQTVTWKGFGSAKPVGIDQLPSYALSTVEGYTPIQVQEFMDYLHGQQDAFDWLTQSAGLMTHSEFAQMKKPERKQPVLVTR